MNKLTSSEFAGAGVSVLFRNFISSSSLFDFGVLTGLRNAIFGEDLTEPNPVPFTAGLGKGGVNLGGLLGISLKGNIKVIYFTFQAADYVCLN